MLTLPEFDFHSPTTVDETVTLLTELGPKARIVAGGTDLIPSMKNRLFEPENLISTASIERLRQITWDKQTGLTLGSAVTLTELIGHPAVMENYPVLAHAAGQIATILLQNKGTIGGNILLDTRCLYYNQSYFWRKSVNFCMKKDSEICRVAPSGKRCYAISSSDTVPALMALDASLVFANSSGTHTISILDFYENDGIVFNKISPSDLLVEIKIPPAPRGFKADYLKLRRRQAIDYPMLGVLAGVVMDDQGICKKAHIILQAVHSAPCVVESAQEVLTGKKISNEDIIEASDLAYNAAKPMDLTNLNPGYRKRMVRVFTRRLLESLVFGKKIESGGSGNGTK